MGDNGRSRVESADNVVVIYHVVYSHEGFDESAQALFKLVQDAQNLQPGEKRKLFLDIEGHRNSNDGFDAEMIDINRLGCLRCLKLGLAV